MEWLAGSAEDTHTIRLMSLNNDESACIEVGETEGNVVYVEWLYKSRHPLKYGPHHI